MMLYIQLYIWTIVTGCFTALVLSLLGSQLACRQKSIQTFCIAQGASVGVLLGCFIALYFGQKTHSLFILFFALIFSSLSFLLSEWISKKSVVSKETFFGALLISLMGFNYILTALIPEIEHHFTQSFSGDLTTLSNKDSIFTGIIAVLSLFYFLFNYKKISLHSFRISTFGETISNNREKVFLIVSLLMVSVSVQLLGLLFTCSCLFIPTSIMSLGKSVGLRKHLVQCALLSVITTYLGFVLSLLSQNLPTVPTITLTMIFVGVFYLTVQKFTG